MEDDKEEEDDDDDDDVDDVDDNNDKDDDDEEDDEEEEEREERTTIFCPSSRRQTMRGVGLPVAVQVNVTLSPSLTVTSLVLLSSTISGGT